MRFPLIPVLLLVLPASEIAVFILVGQRIGVLATLGLILLTAIAGSVLLRVQGLSAFRRVLAALESGDRPGKALVDGFMIVLAGILLVLPGFITDLVGAALFIPPMRHWLWRQLRGFLEGRVQFSSFQMKAGGRRTSSDDVIDLDVDEYRRSPRPTSNPSPWIGKDKA